VKSASRDNTIDTADWISWRWSWYATYLKGRLKCASNHVQLRRNVPGKRWGRRRSSLPTMVLFSKNKKTLTSTLNYCTPLHYRTVFYIKFGISGMLDGQRHQYTPHSPDTYIFMWENDSRFIRIWFPLYFQVRINGADREIHVRTIYSWTFLQSRGQPHPVTMTQCRIIKASFTNVFWAAAIMPDKKNGQSVNTKVLRMKKKLPS
jgi:hypothetical protein